MTRSSVARLTKFLGGQSLARVLGICAGLVVVRLLEKEQYGIYAMFGAFVAAAVISTNMGINSSLITLLSRGGTEEQKRVYIQEANSARLLLTLVSIAIFLTVFFLFKADQVVSFSERAIIGIGLAVIVVAQGYASLSRSILVSQQKLKYINRIDPFIAGARFLLLLGLYLLFQNTLATVPILIWMFAVSTLSLYLLSKCEPSGLKSIDFRRSELLRLSYPLIPGQIYFFINGLIPVLALGGFGASIALAEYWALMRITAAFDLARPVINQIGHPYIARGGDELFVKRTSIVLLGVLGGGAFLLATGYFFPSLWLFLLGENYSNLTAFVPIVMGLALIRILSTTFNRANIASGKTKYQFLLLFVGLISQVTAFLVFPITDLSSAFKFTITVSSMMLAANMAIVLRSAFLAQRGTE